MERRPPKPIVPAEREAIWQLANEGVPYREIAARFDRPQGTINRVISDAILEGRIVRRYQRMEDRRD